MFEAFFQLDFLLSELSQFPGQIVRETFLFLLVVLAQGFFLSLQSLDLLQQRITDILFFLLRFGLL